MRLLLVAVCILVYYLPGNAQAKNDDMAVIKLHINQTASGEDVPIKRNVKIQKTYNPVKLVLYLPLFLYQSILSEQISAVCGFEPSCSAFSALSIKKLGLLKGLFLTADRLTRCNGNAQIESEYYLFDPIKAKVIDDPDMYRLKN